MKYHLINKCRFCSSNNLHKYLDLKNMPLVNNLLCTSQDKDEKAPLRVFWCYDCGMSQLDCVVDPEDLFSNYYYRSGMSKHFKNHCKNLANELMAGITQECEGKFIIDIASNDGSLLEQFVFCKVLGIEPAANLAKIANDKGILTHNAFFNCQTALDIAVKYGQADFITAQNVFAHVPDPWNFMHGVKRILKDDGTLIIEAPWVVDMVHNLEPDTVYHEHMSYISVTGMRKFVKNFGMHLEEIKYFKDIHGGTIRFYIKNNNKVTNVSNLWNIENACYRETFLSEYLDQYQRDIETLGENLKNKIGNSKIVGLGAAAKATIICNYFNLKDNVIKIYDNTPEKQGKYQPGTLIPIVPWEELKKETKPMLIFPWNLEKEIKENVLKIQPNAVFISLKEENGR